MSRSTTRANTRNASVPVDRSRAVREHKRRRVEPVRPLSERGTVGSGAAAALRPPDQLFPWRRRQITISIGPTGLPMGFEYYDRVAFINRDRMERYLDAGVVTEAQAALVGYPKLDRLASGGD